MKTDNIVFAIAGVVFGLLAGWVIGTQQAGGRVPAAAAQTASAAAQESSPSGSRAAVLDENQVKALQSIAEKDASNAQARVQLGNLYFDAERYDDAARWYEAALKVDPKNVNASTDLGIAYYYGNQPDRALAQFDRSLELDPKHSKTLLNIGIVRAFGKQDLDGAEKAWEKVIELAPGSPEAAVSKKGLDGLRAAHGQGGTTPVQKPPDPSK